MYRLLLLISLIGLLGCGKSGSGYKEVPPDEVIRRHIQFLNEKNVDAAESCIAKDRRNTFDWHLEDQVRKRITAFTEEENPDFAKSYMETGRGSIVHPHAVKVYRVEIETEHDVEDHFMHLEKDHWHYYVVKLTEDSPWLIDDWGI